MFHEHRIPSVLRTVTNIQTHAKTHLTHSKYKEHAIQDIHTKTAFVTLMPSWTYIMLTQFILQKIYELDYSDYDFVGMVI